LFFFPASFTICKDTKKLKKEKGKRKILKKTARIVDLKPLSFLPALQALSTAELI